ncbi:hypothetical protein [Sphingobium ummariense]|uniref:hypothetical protein n=1 Tax=Sphingobium ummariense TaxID=420994 RepID=UPI001268546A|nr:hypothetical protein [Sphingobium ummariense]
MMQFALIREQGVNFGIIVVKDHVIANTTEANSAVAYWSQQFGCPTILFGARDHRLYGRRDLVRFVSGLHYSQIPWRKKAA